MIRTVSTEQWFEMAASRGNTRAATGKYNLAKKRFHHEFRNNFFSSRVTDEWNGLPDNIKEARTVSSFKRLYIGTTARALWMKGDQ